MACLRPLAGPGEPETLTVQLAASKDLILFLSNLQVTKRFFWQNIPVAIFFKNM